MTWDAFSDVVLFAVCAWIAWGALLQSKQTSPTHAGFHAGFGLAAVLIGFAALLGVIKFSSFTDASALVKGAHLFASMLASVAAFPILAFSLANPRSAIATRFAGAWWLTFVLAGFGVAVVVLGFKPWAQIVPAVCALWIGYTAVLQKHPRKIMRLCGWLSLLACFAANLLISPSVLLAGVLSKVQLFHYFFALALWLLWRAQVSSDMK